jgi:hypothetical protein
MQLFGRAEAFLSQGHNFERAGTGNARDLENLLFLFWFVFFFLLFFFLVMLLLRLSLG